MLLREKDSQRPPFGTSEGLGRVMLRLAGDFLEEVNPADLDGNGQPLPPIGPTTWSLIESRLRGRWLLKVECPRCHKGLTFVSDVPDSAKLLKKGFFHCGSHEQCPEETFEQFKNAVTSGEKTRKAVEEKQRERQKRREEDQRAGFSIVNMLK